MAGRLTWQRRLRMALDAAKGMVHLHSHRPTILHRDLKVWGCCAEGALALSCSRSTHIFEGGGGGRLWVRARSALAPGSASLVCV
jgi:hypothetical protein